MNSKVGNLTKPAPHIWSSVVTSKQLNLNKLSDADDLKRWGCQRSQKPTFEFFCVYCCPIISGVNIPFLTKVLKISLPPNCFKLHPLFNVWVWKSNSIFPYKKMHLKKFHIYFFQRGHLCIPQKVTFLINAYTNKYHL